MKHKMYTLSNDMKSWLQSLINFMQSGTRKTQAQNWHDTHTTVSNDDLYILVSLYVNDSGLYPQAQAFSDWVKGGVRPDDPH